MSHDQTRRVQALWDIIWIVQPHRRSLARVAASIAGECPCNLFFASFAPKKSARAGSARI
jgi:hypothetical protein